MSIYLNLDTTFFFFLYVKEFPKSLCSLFPLPSCLASGTAKHASKGDRNVLYFIGMGRDQPSGEEQSAALLTFSYSFGSNPS